MNVEIRRSPIHRSGVYARKAFRKGDVVLNWDTSHRIPRQRATDFQGSDAVYLHPYDAESLFVVQSPECFVNHSCTHNTEVMDFMDVAIRDIAAGEEITSNYETDGAGLSFECTCGSPNCRGTIGAIK